MSRRIALAALLLFSLVLLAGVVVMARFDPNRHKDDLVRLVHRATQRTLTVTGDLRLVLLPRLALETGPMQLSERDGVTPFASLQQMHATVALWPLLERRLEVGNVVLDGLAVQLRLDARGTLNIADLLSSGDDAGLRTEIAGVEIRNGTLTFDDAGSGLRAELARIAARTGAIGPGRDTRFDAGFEARSARLLLDAGVELSGVYHPEGARHVLRNVEVSLDGALAGLTAAAGHLSVEADLDTNRAFGVRAVKLTLRGTAATRNQVDVDLRVAGAGLDGDRFRLDGTEATGTVRRDDGDWRGTVSLPHAAGPLAAVAVDRGQVRIAGRRGAMRLGADVTGPLQLDLETIHLQSDALQLIATIDQDDMELRVVAAGPWRAAPGAGSVDSGAIVVDLSGHAAGAELGGQIRTSMHVTPQDLRALPLEGELHLRRQDSRADIRLSCPLAGTWNGHTALGCAPLQMDLDGRVGANAVKGRLSGALDADLDAGGARLPDARVDVALRRDDLPASPLGASLQGPLAASWRDETADAALKGRVDGADARASVAVKGWRAPAWRFDAELELLDLARVIPASQPAARSSPQKAEAWTLAQLRDVDANGRIRIGTLRFDGGSATNARLEVVTAPAKPEPAKAQAPR